MAEDKFFNESVSYDADYDPRFAPRFAELATFMRAPYKPDMQASISASAACRSTAARPTASGPATGRARCATSPR